MHFFQISLVVSAIILIGSNLSVYYRKSPLVWMFCLLPLLCCGAFGSFAVVIQCSLTLLALLLLYVPKHGRKLFLLGSLIAVAIAYGVIVTYVKQRIQRIEEQRIETPIVDLASRIPNPNKASLWEFKLQDHAVSEFENQIDKKTDPSLRYRLSVLHSQFAVNFASSPGFGVFRMKVPAEFRVDEKNPPGPIPNYVLPKPSDESAGEVLTSGALSQAIRGLHTGSVVDFVNPNGFGSFKNPNEVIGFRPHRFSEYPVSKSNWKVDSVELVSMLIHDEPAVYLSKNLPRMDELKESKTRPLDAFEKEGLAELKKGEEIFVRAKDGSARMMGALRNVQQCVECHGGQRGQLLGAFSYRLNQ